MNIQISTWYRLVTYHWPWTWTWLQRPVQRSSDLCWRCWPNSWGPSVNWTRNPWLVEVLEIPRRDPEDFGTLCGIDRGERIIVVLVTRSTGQTESNIGTYPVCCTAATYDGRNPWTVKKRTCYGQRNRVCRHFRTLDQDWRWHHVRLLSKTHAEKKQPRKYCCF